MLNASLVDKSSYCFLARIDVPNHSQLAVRDVIGLEDSVSKKIPVLVVRHRRHVHVKASDNISVRSRTAMHGVRKGQRRIRERSAPGCDARIAKSRPCSGEHRAHRVEIMQATVHAAIRQDASRYRPWMTWEQHHREFAAAIQKAFDAGC